METQPKPTEEKTSAVKESPDDAKAAKILAKKLKFAEKKALKKAEKLQSDGAASLENQPKQVENKSDAKELPDDDKAAKLKAKKAEKRALKKAGKLTATNGTENVENQEKQSEENKSVDTKSIDAKAAKHLARKLKFAEKKALKKAAKLQNGSVVNGEEKKGMEKENKIIAQEMAKTVLKTKITKESIRQRVATAEEDQRVEIREKMLANGKTEEEIAEAIPRVFSTIKNFSAPFLIRRIVYRY